MSTLRIRRHLERVPLGELRTVVFATKHEDKDEVGLDPRFSLPLDPHKAGLDRLLRSLPSGGNNYLQSIVLRRAEPDLQIPPPVAASPDVHFEPVQEPDVDLVGAFARCVRDVHTDLLSEPTFFVFASPMRTAVVWAESELQLHAYEYGDSPKRKSVHINPVLPPPPPQLPNVLREKALQLPGSPFNPEALAFALTTRTIEMYDAVECFGRLTSVEAQFVRAVAGGPPVGAGVRLTLEGRASALSAGPSGEGVERVQLELERNEHIRKLVTFWRRHPLQPDTTDERWSPFVLAGVRLETSRRGRSIESPGPHEGERAEWEAPEGYEIAGLWGQTVKATPHFGTPLPRQQDFIFELGPIYRSLAGVSTRGQKRPTEGGESGGASQRARPMAAADDAP